jgi:flagellin-like hook-associated protein FlgL
MSIFAMQLANAFSARELSGRQSLLKSSIHKLSSGTRLVKAQDDSGMLAVKMKMDAAKYKNASSMNKLASAVSYTDMQDGILNNAQSILTRMSELKGLSINDPLKSEQDIDVYNNEFRDLQRQLFQLSKTTFNGTSLFATTTKKFGGEEVRFRGSGQHKNSTSIITGLSTISLQKLPFLAALTVQQSSNSLQTIDQAFYGTGYDKNGDVIPIGTLDGNWKDSDGNNVTRVRDKFASWDWREPDDSLSKWVNPNNGELALDFDLTNYHKDDVQISFDIASVQILDIKLNGQKISDRFTFGNTEPLKFSTGEKTLSDVSNVSVDISDYLQDGINQLSFDDHLAPYFKVKNVQISAVKKDSGNTDIGYSDRLKNNGTIALAVENDLSLANLNDVQISYFKQAIENISYLRVQTSATKSRLKFTSDLEYENKSLTNKTYGRIADVDYALENSSLAKQKIMTSASAAMIAQANTMGDVVLAMLN